MKNCCTVPSNSCIHSRRCFMSGEYCSQLANIQKAREKLHAVKEIETSENNDQKIRGREINAFVIMNFSNMSDVAYKWQLRPFVESLKDYIYFEGDHSENLVFKRQRDQEGDTSNRKIKEENKVIKINVVRADSNYDSNYVICNRVCQQIQIADLIVVDVSSENNNVFYEFGMAMAMGKLILPICFSESFYQIKLPKALDAYIKRHFEKTPLSKDDNKSENQQVNAMIEHLKRHIDCYPWRRALFENYGLRYRNKRDSDKLGAAQDTQPLPVSEKSTTQYIAFEDAVEPRYGFSDLQYSRFPYAEVVPKEEGAQENSPQEILGKQIYTRLGKSYNNARYEQNTLVVYTMNGFLNGEQVGDCICNFYDNYTKKFRDEHCFCGDRVGILLEPSDIPEHVKDSKEDRHLLYNVGDIIHLGTNEATFSAQRNMIKTADYLAAPVDLGKSVTSADAEKLLIFTKNHIRNRAIPIYPHRPIYVTRVNDGLQPDLLDAKDELETYYCYFHVMLRTLKYVNEVIVDISKNALASLFWLGAAHGANVNAITVQHEQSDQERILLTGSPEKRERAIFDVAGLWSALLRSHEVEQFYQQLASVQKGIEQRSKLILSDHEAHKAELDDMLYGETKRIADYTNPDQELVSPGLQRLLYERKYAEKLALESYYRDRFWKPMMRNKHLHIFFSQSNPKDANTAYPRITVSKWDIDALSTLSHYLSVRTHVGEYSFESLEKDGAPADSSVENFIAIGNGAKPIFLEKNNQWVSLAEAIAEELNPLSKGKPGKSIHVYVQFTASPKGQAFLKDKCSGAGDSANGDSLSCKEVGVIQFQGFFDGMEYIYSQIPCPDCYRCEASSQDTSSNDGADGENQSSVAQAITANEFGIMKCVLPNYTGNQSDKKIPRCQARLNKLLYSLRFICSLKRNDQSINAHHYQVAQLILWREVDRDTGQVNYRAALNGASGPATKALSALVVNDTHRKQVFHWEQSANVDITEEDKPSIRTTPLSIMQQELRTNLLERIKDEICTSLKNTADSQNLKDKVVYSAILYLSTVLYRYFIPFLSVEDEKRITNGLTYFLASLIASEGKAGAYHKNTQTIAEQQDIIGDIKRAVRNSLQELHGVEAFYQVKVLSKQGSETDTRSCVDIDVLSMGEKQGGRIPPKCLFFKKEFKKHVQK